MSPDRGSSLTTLRLYCSLSLQLDYNHFRGRLEQLPPLPDLSTLPTTHYKADLTTHSELAIKSALEILHTAGEAEKDEDRGEVDDDLGALAADRDKAGQLQTPMDGVDNALKILVHNAIEEFGFIPRVVYSSVLRARDTGDGHAVAVEKLTDTDLQEIVSSFAVDRGFISDISHQVIAVFPHPPTYLVCSDRWAIDFKSIRIARKVMESMQLQENERLRELYWFFHKFPDSFNLAGWFFEAIVHRLFSGSWQSEPVPQPIRMDREGSSDSPAFSADPTSSTPDTSSTLRAGSKAVTGVNFTNHQLSDVTLDNDKYYIPTADIHSLFDSFTIVLNPHMVVISVFRITISLRNEGSAEGYLHIRKIVRRVRKLLGETSSNATVKVAYVLVCPDDGSEYQWQMPIGWNKDTETHDHRGDGFCIHVPVPRYHGWI